MKATLSFVALLICNASFAVITPASRLPNYDKREQIPPANVRAAQRDAASALKQKIRGAEVHVDKIVGSPRFVYSTERFLTDARVVAPPVPGAQPNPPDAAEMIATFVEENRALFGHGAGVISAATLKRDFTTEHNGMRTIVRHQHVDDKPVFEAVFIAHVTRNGQVAAVSSLLLPDAPAATRLDNAGRAALAQNAAISARDAVAIAAKNVGEKCEAGDLKAENQPEGAERLQQYSGLGLIGNARASLVWLPFSSSDMRLCWRVILKSAGRGETFQTLVDVQTGEVLVRHCWTLYIDDASYRVFNRNSPSPFSPGHDARSSAQPTIVEPVLIQESSVRNNTASPNGWIFASVNETRGPNVDAHLDALNENNIPPPGIRRPQGVPNRVFNFAADLNAEPTTDNNKKAAVVNLFYWCNWMHDRLYELGFTEAAGNFQGNDAVQADVQDSSDPNATGGQQFNNANFDPTPDGTSPRIQMYLWDGPVNPKDLSDADGPNPARDGDLDVEIILHEYTHGLSTRRVGGGMMMSAPESLGLGEGWSDFYALALLSDPTDDPNAAYPIAGYSLYKIDGTGFLENYYFGLRSYPYATDLFKNPLTFKNADIRQQSIPPGVPVNPHFPYNPSSAHSIGQVWCVTLWEARALLIARLGYSVGNDKMLRLVTDGMNLTPPNPHFLQARDAILLADRISNGGANLADLWAAFAKRGMGYSASYSSADLPYPTVHEAFDLPPANAWVWKFDAGGTINSSPAIGPDGTIYFGAADGKLYALNADGTKKWHFTGGAAFNSSPAIASDGAVYIGCDDQKLYAVAPSGVLKWVTAALGSPIRSSPAVGPDDAAYVTFGSKVDAFTSAGVPKRGGGIYWPANLTAPVVGSPALGRGGQGAQKLYVGGDAQKVYTFGLNGLAGSEITVPNKIIRSSTAVGFDGTLYFTCANSSGTLLAVTPGVGILWQIDTGQPINTSPIVGPDDTVFVGGADGRLHARDPNGYPRPGWPFMAGAAINTDPVVGDDGTVFFGTAAGKLHAVNSSGTERWNISLGVASANPTLGETANLYFPSGNSLYALRVGAQIAHGAWPSFGKDARRGKNADAISLRLTPHAAGTFQFSVYGPDSTITIERAYTLSGPWDLGPGTVTWADGVATYTTDLQSVNAQFFRARRIVAGQPDTRSQNSVGYVKVSAPNGYSLIANQLNRWNNSVTDVFPIAPDGTFILKWDEAAQSFGQVLNYIENYGWLDSAFQPGQSTLMPGEAAFINNPGPPFVFVFQGEVPQGFLVSKVAAAYSFHASFVPQAGPVDTLGLTTLANGDTASKWNGSAYVTYTRQNGAWSPSTPSLNVGEGMLLHSAAVTTWPRTFTVFP